MIGNAILRGVLHAHYTTNTVAAAIGAVGGVVSAFIFGIVFACLPKDENGQLRWPFSLVWSVAVATLSGPIGLDPAKYHINCHDIDVLHAMGPGLSLVLAVLFSPLIIAVKLGFKWVYIRSNESWSDTGVTVLVAQLERPRQNPQQYRPQVQQPYRAYGNSSSLL
ncbi:hypothetical protein BJ912DRAFT_949118 [Pholiota molesta]|nr:hypothetical protein BJ912DRAFT_949118 [Pholiota molesta]